MKIIRKHMRGRVSWSDGFGVGFRVENGFMLMMYIYETDVLLLFIDICFAKFRT